MQRPTKRPFRLADALVLVASCALGFAFVRVSLDYELTFWSLSTDLMILRGSWYAVLALFPPTVAGLLLRLRKPRPRLRTLCTQPGFVSAIMVVLVTAHNFLCIGLDQLAYGVPGKSSLYDQTNGFAMLFTVSAAAAVLASWTLLAVGGRWRPERSWMDRLGRALGVFWLLSGLVPPILNLTFR